MTRTLNQFIAANGISMSADWADTNPNFTDPHPDMSHYKCVLSKDKPRRSMTTYFSMGSALTREPSAADVLDCLASDSAGIGEQFEDWAREYGYDPDSRKAERSYKTCQRQAKILLQFLGREQFEALLYDTERQ